MRMRRRIISRFQKCADDMVKAEEMVNDLKEKVFPDRAINFLAVTKEGKKDVRVL